jgi:hypothetical protein
MAGGASGAGSGAVLGLALVLLIQQFGYLDFSSNLVNALVYIVVFVVVFGVLFGIIGRMLKGRALRKMEAASAPPT